MTITVTIAFQAAEGQRDALVAKMIEIIPDTLAYDGCQRIEFVESVDAAGSLLLIEDWESTEHYDAYKAWRRESGTSVLGSGLVEGGATTFVFNPLDKQVR